MDAVEALVQALATSARDQWLVLAGVGWFGVKRYKAYEGRNPRTGERVSVPDKWLPFFTVDPDLDRALAGVAPSGASFADDRERYLRAIRPDGDDGDDEDPATVTRSPGVETIADTIRRGLCAGEPVDIPGLGVFDILEKPARHGANPQTGEEIIIPARRIVRFQAAEALVERLRVARSSH